MLSLVLLVGCASDPVRDFEKWLAASRRGDTEAFKAGLTRRSRAFVDGIWTLERQHPILALPRKFSGKARLLTRPNAALIRGDKAWIEVESGGRRERLILLKEDGRWRIDLFLLVRVLSP